MDLVFLFCWTAVFLAGIFLIWRYLVNRTRVYMLMLLNMAFLVSLFYLYPIVLEIFPNL